ncbi:hypothetical protein D3P07_25985 [Paenibacillus sp. 1011MAR3C5]|uniref:DUF4097 family beta strand repeat-containing protein n=1 Tax=Paenibacillus sp. 1011MAR3C5 TaxID=1675787 RepID=UPI000E6C1FDA|nr:DUF4097 family beta strand repeat-containing protein [Paenibacillus sp. 1011MAR3C5]RJE83085.1 hypothetical protein D3P07_25985 [Paenibacillus sp. 1011MAR3C5]
MRPKTTIGIILIIVGIIGVLYVYENGSGNTLLNIRNFFASEINEQQTIDISDVRNLDISSGSLDVRLVQGSGSDAVIKLEGWASKNYIKNMKLESTKKDGTLQLSLKNDRGIRFGFGFRGVKMTVELPEKTWNQLDVDLDSGDLSLEQMRVENAKLQTNSGDVEAADLQVDSNLSVSINSGDLTLRTVTARKMDLSSQSGDLSVKGYEADSIDFKVSSGDVHFEDGTAELAGKTSSGNIMMKSDNITRHADLRTGSGDVVVILENNPNSLSVQFKAGSGDGVIQKDDFTYDSGSKGANKIKGRFGSGEIKLNVQTGSGDFVLK